MSFDNKITIMPFVSLYKNVFQDVDSLFDIVKNFQPSRLIAEWEPWYELGSRTKIENTHLNDILYVPKLTERDFDVEIKKDCDANNIDFNLQDDIDIENDDLMANETNIFDSINKTKKYNPFKINKCIFH